MLLTICHVMLLTGHLFYKNNNSFNFYKFVQYISQKDVKNFNPLIFSCRNIVILELFFIILSLKYLINCKTHQSLQPDVWYILCVCVCLCVYVCIFLYHRVYRQLESEAEFEASKPVTNSREKKLLDTIFVGGIVKSV